ncbi:MAG: hypothetical protein LBF33_01195 [Oscillospiraceae bacterium]|jgi:hypothetical protein|nr:hypothetical protein [Oscillospiraceae bacterium]
MFLKFKKFIVLLSGFFIAFSSPIIARAGQSFSGPARFCNVVLIENFDSGKTTMWGKVTGQSVAAGATVDFSLGQRSIPGTNIVVTVYDTPRYEPIL